VAPEAFGAPEAGVEIIDSLPLILNYGSRVSCPTPSPRNSCSFSVQITARPPAVQGASNTFNRGSRSSESIVYLCCHFISLAAVSFQRPASFLPAAVPLAMFSGVELVILYTVREAQ